MVLLRKSVAALGDLGGVCGGKVEILVVVFFTDNDDECERDNGMEVE